MMALPTGFFWEPNCHIEGAMWLVRERDHLIVASVCPRIDSGWVSSIDRHRVRGRIAVAPSRKVAIRWVELWVRARSIQLSVAVKEPLPGCGTSIKTFRAP